VSEVEPQSGEGDTGGEVKTTSVLHLPLLVEKSQMRKHSSGFITGIRVLHSLSLSAILFFLLSLSADCQTDSIQAKIELKSWVDRSEVPFNQKLTFTVQASWEGEQDRFSLTPVTPPECESFEILGSSSLNETKTEEGKTKSLKTFKFNLKPIQTGAGRIGSVQLSYIDNLTQDSSSLSTQPINVQITPPVEKKGPKYRNILIAVILLVLIYVIYSARRKAKRIEITKEKETENLSPEEESLEEGTLKKLDVISEEVQKGRLENFSSDVYKLLTGYLEAKYQIVTSGKTTNDIISSLSNLDMSSEKFDLLKNILSTCDLVKFAGEKMEKEKCEKITNQVREFLEQNR
jgi:hypothetical protein